MIKEKWSTIKSDVSVLSLIFFTLMSQTLSCFLTGIHSMQDWTANKGHGVTRKEAQKD